MQSEPRDQRVPIMLTASELRNLDEWRRQELDLPSRSEAIRRLIEAGLKANPGASSGGSDAGSSTKPSGKPASRARKPAPERKTEPPRSKLDQIRALREQGVR